MKYDIIIIGGGASGLTCAIKAKTKSNKVLIIEHNDRVGKKILSTGNGKCNLTNLSCRTELFNNNPENIYPYFSFGSKKFVEKVISAFDCYASVNFFESLGILTLDKNGYIYPRSEQASSICDILRLSATDKGVDIETGFQINKISSVENSEYQFSIDNKYFCRKLVIATGGKAAAKTGSDGSGYKYAVSFGHHITKTYPALCGLKSDFKYIKELSGVRCDARIRLFSNGAKELANVFGNLQFTNYGISGIPVFQISSIAAIQLDKKQKIYALIDLLPEYDMNRLITFLSEKKCEEKDLFLGILNKKISDVILKITPFSKDKKAYITALVNNIKTLKINLSGINSFEEAQTTCGGVCTDEIDPDTMESKLIKGLYFTGEVIDVNGICGGYNLQWAWSTAHIAAKAMLESL